MTSMLASVRSLDEALIALDGGADLIDLKEPARGALGALDHAAVRICVQAIGGRKPVSATIGDLPSMQPEAVVNAVERTGVDFIKIGFFAHARAFDCASALSELARDTRLVAVLFADEPYDLALVETLARDGFAGVMLDTAHKTGKSLRDWRSEIELEDFVARGRSTGMLTGLAGSLRRDDIPALLAMEPDYLGFRGALCSNGARAQNLDARLFAEIRVAMSRPAMPQFQRTLAA
jgi:uncharacterized protein (UPF0264 family)